MLEKIDIIFWTLQILFDRNKRVLGVEIVMDGRVSIVYLLANTFFWIWTSYWNNSYFIDGFNVKFTVEIKF